jgi:hypothetical protein
MKKLTILYTSLTIAVLLAASCTKNLSDLNQNPKKPDAVVPSTLFANAELELTNNLTSTNVNLNIFRLLAQQWTETTYPDESQYDLSTRNIPQNFWHGIYRDVLADLAEARKLLEVDETVTAGVKKNQMAQIEVLNVYAYSVLLTTYGNIPYKDALNIDNLSPKYEDAKGIYLDLLTRLDAAIKDFDPASESFGLNDRLYDGKVDLWIKFANSLKLKLGMILIDADQARATKAITEAAPKAFTSNDDNASYAYSTIPPNTNPLWVDLVQSGRKDFVAANTFIDTLKALKDPRLPFYFNEVEGEYVGGTYGTSNDYSVCSAIDSVLLKKDFEALLLDYSEVEFLLAEAVERGIAVGGTAIGHYSKAITASITYWGGTEEEAVAYLANPDVNYVTAKGGYKGKIGTQKWIALYNRGFDAWTEWRRFDYPKLVAPPDAISEIPVRYTYPVSEQNLNQKNYEDAVKAIGGEGDVVTTKLFWDKF